MLFVNLLAHAPRQLAPKLLWKSAFAGYSPNSIVQAKNGNLYVTSGGSITAFTARGKRIWSYQDKTSFAYPPVIGTDGHIYLAEESGTYDNGMTLHHIPGYMVVLDQRGRPLWAPEGEDYELPIIGSDGTVVLTSTTGITAFNPSGRKKWANTVASHTVLRNTKAGDLLYSSSEHYFFETRRDGYRRVLFRLSDLLPKREDSDIWAGDPELISEPPKIDRKGTIYLAAVGFLESSRSKSIVWALHPSKMSLTALDREWDSVSNLSLSESGMMVFQIGTNKLKAFSPSHLLLWNFTMPGKNPTFKLMPDGTIYISSKNYLFALSGKGSKKWSFHTCSNITGFTASNAGSVYINTIDHHLYSIDRDGHLHWSFKIPGSFNISPTVCPNKRVYVAANGILYAFNP